MEFINLLIILFAIALDAMLGEPRRWHPLVGFGAIACFFERVLNRSARATTIEDKKSASANPAINNHRFARRCLGVIGWLFLVVPLPLMIVLLQSKLSIYSNIALSLVCLYFCLGWTSLRQHAQAVSTAFESSGIDAAREQVGRIVSRDTDSMDERAVARATIESVLENGSDAVFAPLFWFVLLGPAAAVAYRLANTLDAMWGYRTERFNHFGWASAKADDVLNYFPARLTALSYALLGNPLRALRCWRHQASACASPNGGPVMCSGAGSLNILLGGGAHYHGEWQPRAVMGEGASAAVVDIARSVSLINRTLFLWALVLALLSAVGWL